MGPAGIAVYSRQLVVLQRTEGTGKVGAGRESYLYGFRSACLIKVGREEVGQ